MSAETSQSSKRNLNQTKQAPIFLSLPLEIRLQIYDVLRNPRGNPHHVSLLYLTCVCRQLRDENFPSLLPKNKCFRDRIKFTEWASRIDPKWLSYTKELSLNLKSNLGEEFHASVGEIERAKKQSLREGLGPEAPGTGEWWEMKYLELLGKDIPTAEQAAAEEEEQEAGKELSTSTPGRRPCKPAEPPSSRPIPQLWDILCSLSRLRALKISLLHFVRDGPNGPNPPPLETMLDTMVPEHYLIAQMLPHAFPSLISLSFFSTPIHLDFLSNFQHLQHLSLIGTSLTDPPTTLSILSSLKNLTSLGLSCPSPHAFYRTRTPNFPEKYQSITSQVLAGLPNPLTSFEISHMPYDYSYQYITVKFLLTLFETHGPSLRGLRIGESCYDYYEREVVDLLLGYLPRLERLESVELSLMARYDPEKAKDNRYYVGSGSRSGKRGLLDVGPCLSIGTTKRTGFLNYVSWISSRTVRWVLEWEKAG